MIAVVYSAEHLWLRVDDDGVATVGLSDYAQSELGEISFVEPPEPGRDIVVGEEIGVVEAEKAMVELCAPTDGTVIEVNDVLNDEPALINASPLDDGWLFRLQLEDPDLLDDLMDEDAYVEYLETLD